MKIIADDNIALVEDYFSDLGELVLKPGREIAHKDTQDAEILLTRSTTAVNKKLLQDTAIKFVGSTVAGTDHLDIDYLNAAGVQWYAAEGCNAVAVAEYVVCVVAALQQKKLLPTENLRAAVIGVGRIGRLVVDKLKSLGFEVIECDPFHRLTPLDKITDVDLICLHTPLTHAGAFPTYHLIDKNFLLKQKNNAVLLNAGRGSVINFSDLKNHGKHVQWCFDVFKNEPNIDKDILQQAVIATPHIAGHTVQAKLRGLEMVYQAMLKHKIISNEKIFQYPTQTISIKDKNDWREFALSVFNPFELTQQLKDNPQLFDKLRKDLQRNEFDYVKVN